MEQMIERPVKAPRVGDWRDRDLERDRERLACRRNWIGLNSWAVSPESLDETKSPYHGDPFPHFPIRRGIPESDDINNLTLA